MYVGGFPFAMLVAFLFLSLLFSYGLPQGPPGSIPMNVINHAGSNIDVFWIDNSDPLKENYVTQTLTPIRNGSKLVINSFPSHHFAVKFSHDKIEDGFRVIEGLESSSNCFIQWK